MIMGNDVYADLCTECPNGLGWVTVYVRDLLGEPTGDTWQAPCNGEAHGRGIPTGRMY